MPFRSVRHDQSELVAQVASLLNAAWAVDDPYLEPRTPAEQALSMEFGWDLEPADTFLYAADDGAEPVGVMTCHGPRRDNLHLFTVDVTVHPDQRRRGYGSIMLEEGLRLAAAANRNTVWVFTREADPAGDALAGKHGFAQSSRDARRVQRLADVDTEAVEELWQRALSKSGDYRLERLTGADSPDEVLTELIAVTASINDAPMGELTWEPELFDLQRLKDFQTAARGRGDRVYRVLARHTGSGEVGGHTVMFVNDFHPTRAAQADTAVHSEHRGHRLGALLKIDMMRWLAQIEPQAVEVETWNNVDNDHMISINEQIGYRLNGVFVDWERKL